VSATCRRFVGVRRIPPATAHDSDSALQAHTLFVDVLPREMAMPKDVPVVVQHTRLDSRQPALALLSTIGFGADD
jgi:hypothetical protein